MTTFERLRARFRLDEHEPNSMMVCSTIIAAQVLDDLGGINPLDHPDLASLVAFGVMSLDLEVFEVLNEDAEMLASLAGGATMMILCLGTEASVP